MQYNEDHDLSVGDDKVFLRRMGEWLTRAEKSAKTGDQPWLMGRGLVSRLVRLATESSASEAIYVQVTDWYGLYIDGHLVAEGDSINLPYELENRTVKFTIRPYNEADENYVLNVGGFPETWDELLDHQYMWEEDWKEEDEEDGDV